MPFLQIPYKRRTHCIGIHRIDRTLSFSSGRQTGHVYKRQTYPRSLSTACSCVSAAPWAETRPPSRDCWIGDQLPTFHVVSSLRSRGGSRSLLTLLLRFARVARSDCAFGIVRTRIISPANCRNLLTPQQRRISHAKITIAPVLLSVRGWTAIAGCQEREDDRALARRFQRFSLPCNIISRIRKHVYHSILARSWIKCFLVFSVLCVVLYAYLFLNVSSLEKSSKSIDGIWRSLTRKEHAKSQSSGYHLIAESQSRNNQNVECDTIHVAMVSGGYNSTFTLVTVVKSILFYRTNPLHFHLLVDEIARRTLSTLFQTWNLPHVNITFYGIEKWVPIVSWIPNKHYSGVYGLLKLILPDAIRVDRVLVLDTDVTVLNDVSALWRMFEEFSADQALGLVENQSNWYVKMFSNGQRPWPALDRGFNTGVMLMHLQRLRKEEFVSSWANVTRHVLRYIPETSLADQDVINALIKERPGIVYRIECTWNIQLSDRTTSYTCYRDNSLINIVHWNSPRKQDVRNRHVNDFRKLHRIFLEMDGNLLRKRLFGCDKYESLLPYNESSQCQEFEKGATTLYRTHLFLIEYDYKVESPTDVALVTQCSIDRIPLLEALSEKWSGTISVALYLTDAEVQNFLNFVRNSVVLRTKKNIAYHIVYKDGDLYPINYLRNIAMSYVSTPFVFQLDVDFLPNLGLHKNLSYYIQLLSHVKEFHKIALIVPAFETQRYRFTFPENKQQLLRFLKRGIFYTFRYHVWMQGHAATNYSFYWNSTAPYEVSWEPDFEPYVVVSKSVPLYDTRFSGFGWNKVSHSTHLAALGYKYIVLPDTFIIHRPHAPSLDIVKFRTDLVYRRCLKKLKDEFVKELIMKYGDSALSKLKIERR